MRTMFCFAIMALLDSIFPPDKKLSETVKKFYAYVMFAGLALSFLQDIAELAK